MYLYGGLNAQSESLGDLWSFTLADGWSKIAAAQPPSLLPCHSHAALAWNTPHEGQVLVIVGGQSGATLSSDIHVYSPSSKEWHRQLSYGAHVHRHSAHAAVQIDGRIYILGGIVQDETDGSAERTARVFVHNADSVMEPPSLVAATTDSITLSWIALTGYDTLSSLTSCPETLFSEYQAPASPV